MSPVNRMVAGEFRAIAALRTAPGLPMNRAGQAVSALRVGIPLSHRRVT